MYNTNSNNSRQTILSSALSLFSSKGYDAVSVNDITVMANITKPTLYHFFGSKEGLLRELLESKYDCMNRRLEEISIYVPKPENYEEDVLPQLCRIVHFYFEFAQEENQFYNLVLSFNFAPQTSRAMVVGGELHEKQYEILEYLFLEIANAHGNLRGKEKQFAYSFIALINAQVSLWYKGFETLNRETAVALVKQFMHGIFA